MAVKQLRTHLEADAYIQGFIIPLLERVGLKVTVEHSPKEFTLIIRLPRA